MSLNIFYYSSIERKTKSILIENNESIEGLHQKIASNEEINDRHFKLFLNGKQLTRAEELRNDCYLRLNYGLVGGKGGFGSMLRAIGAQIEKTTNREACRDLSGRRLRDVNEEKRIKEWIAKQAQRKEESERKRKEKLQRLAAQPKCEFNDIEFERKRSEIPDIVEEALQYGLQQQQSSSSGSSGAKRKNDDLSVDQKLKKKKHSLWLGIDEVEDDSDEAEEESNDKDISKEEAQKEDDEEDSKKVEEDIEPVTDNSGDNQITDGVEASPIDVKVNESVNETQILIEKNETIHEENGKSDDKSTVSVNDCQEEVPLSADSNNKECLTQSIVESSSQASNEEVIVEPLNLMDYESVDQLENLGLDRLKRSLMALGLKCGGTLQERAKRLWSIRGLDVKDIPKNLFASKRK